MFLICLIICSGATARSQASHTATTAPGAPTVETALSPLARVYTKGDHFRYKLTCTSYQNGKWTSTTVSEAQLIVGYDSLGVPYDEVHWLSSIQMGVKDTLDLGVKARAIPPYRISLDPKGSMALPPLTEPAMTEPITDLHTFFVAVSPALGATRLKNAGDSYTKPQPAIGDFSNGANILKGQDCLQTSMSLMAISGDTDRVQTRFFPPLTNGLSYITPEMSTPVIADTVNNFQMLMPAGNGKFNVQYGRELFTIDSKISKAEGKLLDASMFNLLSLRLNIMCDQQYQHCAMQMPMSIARKLSLELEPE